MTKPVMSTEEIAEMIGKSTSIVNQFYHISYVYPVKIARNTADILKAGLLPWAKSGLRKNIILRIHGISPDQITHEMSHFALRKITGHKPIPLWFDEGLACYISGMNFIGDKDNLKKALLEKNVPDLMQWIGFMGKLKWLHQMYIRRNKRIIYGLSYHLIDSLIKMYGHQAMLNFIMKLEHADFSSSFRHSFGIPEGAFYKNFLSTLNE